MFFIMSLDFQNKNLKNQNSFNYLKDNLKLNLFIGAAVLFIIAMLSLSSARGQGSIQNNEPNPNAFVQVEQKPLPLNFTEVRDSISSMRPIFGESAIEGNVVLKVLVDENGNYVKHIVLKQVHPILCKAVESQVNKLRFTPALQEGKPIKFWLVLAFNFKW